MQSNEAAKLIRIHPNTVRLWTTKYKEFFSSNGQGGSGSQRSLTEDDVRVLAYIASLKHDGLISDEVVAALKQAHERGFDMLPLPTSSNNTAIFPVVSREAAETAVVSERKIMAEHIRWLEGRVDELKGELKEVRVESTGKIDHLTRKLIEAETELNMWRKGWRPPIE